MPPDPDVLGQVRADLAELRGVVIERIDALREETRRVAGRTDALLAIVQNHGTRLDLLEQWRRDREEAEAAKREERRDATRVRWTAAGWVVAVIGVLASVVEWILGRGR
jgi:hypothetical protein